MFLDGFSPDHVLVHHANNDAISLMAQYFRPDYAHYRKSLPLDRNEMFYGSGQILLGRSIVF